MKAKIFLLMLMIVLVALGGFPAYGQEGPVALKSVEIKNQFPEGVLFQASAETAAPATISEIRLEMRVKGSNRGAYAYLEFVPATTVEGSYLLRASGAQYKPPGTLIEYYFIITDSEKRTLETPKETYLYLDNRFEWASVSEGLVEVYYYGPTKTRAEFILDAAAETIERMGELLGVRPSQPIRIIAYNNPQNMFAALPFQSETTQRELLTQGQAWYDYGLLLMLGGDSNANGIASHEMTHMLVSEATKNAFVDIPAWLNEGLAEYGNVNPGSSYDGLLSEAIAAGQLLPLRHMQSLPGLSRDILLVYAQGRQVVRHMVETYGADKVKELFAAFNKGLRIDEALKSVYGFDQDGLDNSWRRSRGLPLVQPAPADEIAPPPPTSPAEEPEPVPVPARRPAFGCAGPRAR
ncbi:MAG: hypothetical protein HYX90_10650 [Chloroflexi bacterium]|nr:hypothetical protein [Chloroflexota bacterium]